MDTIIKPEMIKWARERASLSVDALAAKLHVTPERVLEWENGTVSISMANAEKLAKHALIATAWLFGDAPPDEHLPLPDFRTHVSKRLDNPSPELLETVFDAQEKLNWYKDYLLQNNEPELLFVGSITPNTPLQTALAKMRELLSFGNQEKMPRNYESYLQSLMDSAEASGIIVLKNGIVKNNTRRPLNPDEFRGFAIADKMAPLIFINGRDTKAAQIFTFVHEVVHILLGQSSLDDAPISSSASSGQIEAYCNKLASEFLVPEEQISALFRDCPNMEEFVDKCSKQFAVSRLVIIHRSHNLNLMDDNTWKQMIAEEKCKFLNRKDKSSGGNFYESLKFRVSPMLARLVISELRSGSMLYRDAFRFLGVKNASSVKALESYVGAMR